MSEFGSNRVRVRGTELIGTSVKQVTTGYYEVNGRPEKISPVLFEETGEIKLFLASSLDFEPDKE